MYVQEFLIKAFIYTWTGLDYEESSPSGARHEMVRNADRVLQDSALASSFRFIEVHECYSLIIYIYQNTCTCTLNAPIYLTSVPFR